MNLFKILIDKMNYLLQFQKEVILLILFLKEAYKMYKKYKVMNITYNKPFKINPYNVHYVEKMLN